MVSLVPVGLVSRCDAGFCIGPRCVPEDEGNAQADGDSVVLDVTTEPHNQPALPPAAG